MTTKLKTFIFVLAIGFSGTLFAQEHLAESKSLVGMWRQTAFVKNNEGKIIQIKTGNYKVVNPDGTFYAFVTWGTGKADPKADVTTMNMYGTYSITSDSTFTEHVTKHGFNSKMNNSDSELKYKFVHGSDNNAIYMMWKNTSINEWIPEMWERVIFLEKKKEETQKL